MATSTKLPEQLFVVAKEVMQWDTVDSKLVSENLPFGFLNAYEPKKSTWSNKQATQINWAYVDRPGYNARLEKRGDIYYHVGIRFGQYDCITHQYENIPIDEPVFFQPVVWDNIPIPGFTILKSVSRYSTSNKLWRIADPRGVEFEISTACLEQIIDDATILKGGLIDAKCAWMSNKNLVVVP